MEQQDTRNEVAKNSMIKHFPVVGKVKKKYFCWLKINLEKYFKNFPPHC